MRIRRSSVYRTLLVEWDTDRPRCIVGLRGLDRPSVQWHLTLWWHKRREQKSLMRDMPLWECQSCGATSDDDVACGCDGEQEA